MIISLDITLAEHAELSGVMVHDNLARKTNEY